MLRNQLRRMLPLASLALLTGCASNTADKVIVLSPAITGKLCQSIKVIRIGKGDRVSDDTAAVILGNNEARVAWGCKKLENEAA